MNNTPCPGCNQVVSRWRVRHWDEGDEFETDPMDDTMQSYNKCRYNGCVYQHKIDGQWIDCPYDQGDDTNGGFVHGS